MTTDPRYACDYWLVSRRKCRRYGAVEARTEGGAPLRFCRHHWQGAQPGIVAQFGSVTRWVPS